MDAGALTFPRRSTRQIHVGGVAVGGGAPVSIQSMTTTKTADVEGTLQQIYALDMAGVDIVRCTCNEMEAAEGLARIVPRSPVPIIADIHHQYRMALAAMEAGVHGLRLNPGNIRKPEHIRAVASEARDRGIPIRIGVNGGSLDPALYDKYGGRVTPEAMVESALSEIAHFDANQMRSVWGKEMSMVFQDPMTALNPVMKIGRQITESLIFHLQMENAEARDTAVALQSSVGIPEPAQRMEEYPHQLSGGMRQRVVIAIALACGPKLLFADEPTTALDVTVQAQILNLLQQQQRDRHMAMILVTHDLGVVAGRTDDIAVMYAGKIVERAPTPVLFSSMKMPYTEALVNSIPKIEYASHTRLDTIGGRPPDLVNPPRGCNFAPRCKYVQDRCLQEEPPLLQADTPGHFYRCWFPVGTPENAAALEANLSKGLDLAKGPDLAKRGPVVAGAEGASVTLGKKPD